MNEQGRYINKCNGANSAPAHSGARSVAPAAAAAAAAALIAC